MYLPNPTQMLMNAKERQTTLMREAHLYRQIQQAEQRQQQTRANRAPTTQQTMWVAWRRLLVGATLMTGVLLFVQ